VAPRPLIVEHAAAPDVAGPPPPADGRRGAAPGALRTAADGAVAAEVERCN
jgi:hypothetical protein